MKKLLAILSLLLGILPANGQVCDTALWSPNGPVQSLLLQDSILYVGGLFSQVSPVTGHFVVVDSSSAQVIPPFPKITGRVNCMARDSVGRTYVGGSFNSVGNLAIRNLFRIDSLGNVDPSFQPNPDGEVNALHIYGFDLYVGGNFGFIEGYPRGRGAMFAVTDTIVDLTDTTVYNISGNDSIRDFDPRADGVIYSYCVDPLTGTVLAGGDFQNIGGAGVHYLACLNIISGDVIQDTHQLPWSTSINGPVRSIAVKSGHAFAGGDFTMAFGTFSRKGFVAFKIYEETIDTLINAQLNGFVNDVKLINNRIYIGGSFTVAQGHQRKYLACFSDSMRILPWDPSPGSEVFCISGWKDKVCIGGKFTVVGSAFCYYASIVDSVTGMARAWNPMFDHAVRTILSTNSNQLYCGGDFSGANGVVRNNLCAININTKRPTNWAPIVSSSVSTMAIDNNSLFIGGNFASVDSSLRDGIAAFDRATGIVNAFDPGSNGLIRTIISDDSLVYIGGNFTTTAGQSRMNIACIDFATSSATNWDPGCTGTVNKLLLDHDHLYVGGFYSQIGAQVHDNVSRVDVRNAVPDLYWNCNTDDGVYDLDLHNGKLSMCGWFQSANNSGRQFFAAVDTMNGNLYSDDPGFDNYTRCFARYTTDLFVSGAFNTVGGSLFYPSLCDYDNSSNAFDAWAPLPSSYPQALAVNQDWLFMGGTFIVAGSEYHPYLAMVNVNNITSTNEILGPDFTRSIFPNPADNFCYVNTKDLHGKASSCEVRDVTGRLVSVVECDPGFANDKLKIDLAGLSAGIYLISLRSDEGIIYSGKVTKR